MDHNDCCCMKYLSITTIWILLTVHSSAQDNDKTINNFTCWGGFELNMPFHERSAWGLFAEGYIKRKDLFAQPMGWFWRLGATHYLKNGNRLSGGLAYQYNYPY